MLTMLFFGIGRNSPSLTLLSFTRISRRRRKQASRSLTKWFLLQIRRTQINMFDVKAKNDNFYSTSDVSKNSSSVHIDDLMTFVLKWWLHQLTDIQMFGFQNRNHVGSDLQVLKISHTTVIGVFQPPFEANWLADELLVNIFNGLLSRNTTVIPEKKLLPHCRGDYFPNDAWRFDTPVFLPTFYRLPLICIVTIAH